MAERRIVPGLLRRLDIEAAAIDEQLGFAGDGTVLTASSRRMILVAET